MPKRATASGYRSMWLLAMFDLPVVTSENRKHYASFRKTLMNDGFMMLQYSVYARFLVGEESAETHRRRIRRVLPPDGQVRLLTVTDHQFAKMEVFYGKKGAAPEEAPTQMALF